MAKYVTKQRKLLLEYLAGHHDEELSASKIAAELAEKGISTSAVYRNLAMLAKEHQVRKVGVSDSGETFYQYIGGESCKKSLHFSCIKCKKTYHLSEETVCELLAMVEKRDHFLISKEDTILYGICEHCR